MTGHIYIYGEITSYQDENIGAYGAVNPKDVLNQIKNNSEASELVVHINSPGGDVDAGFAIFDILKTSGKTITTQIEGQCYSIATVIALAGEKRTATQNSEYLIHNPWTFGGGEAKDFKKTQEQLERFEDKIANLYASVGSISFEDAKTEMDKDTYMDLSQAVEYGLITEIIETVKAVAKFNTNKMANEKSILAQVKELLVGKEDVQAKSIVLKDAEGNDIDFPERTEGEVQAGDKAVSESGKLDGEVVMANGNTIVFSNDKVEKVIEKQDKPEFDAVAFKAEVLNEVKEAMKAEQDLAIQAVKDENKLVVDAMQEKLDAKDELLSNLKNIVSGENQETKEVKASATDVIEDKKVNPLVAGLNKLTAKN